MRDIKGEMDYAARGCLLYVGLFLIGAIAWRICLHYDLSFWWWPFIAVGIAIVLLLVLPYGYTTVDHVAVVNMFLSGILAWFICQKFALSTGWTVAIVLAITFVVAPILQLMLVTALYKALMDAKLNQIKTRLKKEEEE